jgi:predicted HTH transcriptional regulator
MSNLEIQNLKIEGNNNIILTDIQGSVLHISVNELIEKYDSQLAHILALIKNIEEPNYRALAQQIQDYQNAQVRSGLDAFNLYMEQTQSREEATTSQSLVGKTVNDLDVRQLKKLFALTRTKEHFKKHKIAKDATSEEKLRTLRLMTNGYVVKGTFLCLANIQNFGEMSGNVDEASFGAFRTLDKTIIKKSEKPLGNVLQQYHALFNYLIDELSPQVMVDIREREWDYSIPQIVVQELLANAFIHRSYEPNARFPVKVEVYPDRLIIENAGQFPEDINPQDILTLKAAPRNKEIARIFYLHKIVEREGSGILRVQNLLKERNMRPAIFEQGKDWVRVTVYKYFSPEELKYANISH